MQWRGVESALGWAYATTSRPVCPLNGRALDLRGGTVAIHANEELSVWDRHAQAALIHSVVNELPVQQRLAIEAAYGVSDEKPSACETLTIVLSRRLETPQTATGAAIYRWAYRGVSERSIARMLGVSRRQAGRVVRGVTLTLDDLLQLGIDNLQTEFEFRGLLRP